MTTYRYQADVGTGLVIRNQVEPPDDIPMVREGVVAGIPDFQLDGNDEFPVGNLLYDIADINGIRDYLVDQNTIRKALSKSFTIPQFTTLEIENPADLGFGAGIIRWAGSSYHRVRVNGAILVTDLNINNEQGMKPLYILPGQTLAVESTYEPDSNATWYFLPFNYTYAGAAPPGVPAP